MKKRFYGVLMLSFAGSHLGFIEALSAQTEILDLDPYTVQATHLDPHFVDFSSFEEKSPAPLESLEDSLSQFSGTYMNNPIGFAGNTELIVRGGEANFTKVQIEGIEVNNPSDSRGGGFGFALLAGMPIESVALAKGSGSSVVGSGAISGVLAFELGNADDESILLAGLGEFDTRSYGAIAHIPLENAQVSGGINHFEESSRYENHEFESNGGFLKSSFSPFENSKLWVSVWTSETEQTRLPEDSGGFLYSASKSLDVIKAKAQGLSFRYLHNLQNDSSISILLGRYIHDNNASSPGVQGGERNPFGVPANDFIDSFERTQMELVYRCSNWEKLNFSAGLEHQKEDARSESVISFYPGFSLPSSYDVERNRNSAFAELAFEVSEQHFLIVSERYDSGADQEGEWSSGIKYGVRSDVINGVYYVSYQEAFKAPSLFALNNALVGNPDLNAETNESYEFGISGSSGSTDLTWRMAIFSQHYNDLIDLSETTQTLVNLSSVDIQGVEFELGYAINSKISVEAQATFLNLDLEDKEEVLRHRPEQQIRTAVVWALNEQQQFVFHYALSGKRWDSSIPTGNRELDVHHELTLRWMAQWGDHFETSLNIRNLLNSQREVLIGYETPGTSLSASAAWSW